MYLKLSILWLSLSGHIVHARDPLVRARSQFQSWYPQFGSVFQHTLDNSCQKEFNDYLYGTTANITIDELTGGDENNLFTQPVIQCILNETSEFIKSDLSSAQIILGLTPTVLALLGASSEETSLLAVIGKRPFLTFLLAVASPSVYTSRAFEYRDPREILRDRHGRHRQQAATKVLGRWKSRLILVAEYLFALGALINVGFINWDLSLQAACTIFAEWTFMPAIWATLAVFVHAIGVGLLRLRSRRTTRERDEPRTETLWKWLRLRAGSELAKGPGREFSRLVEQDNGRVYVEWFDETPLFIFGAWCLSVLTIAHIVFGTLVFSSITFVGPRDAIMVFIRYMASALGCRVVLMFELAGLRETYNAGLDEEAVNPEHQGCEHKVDCQTCGGRKNRPVEVSSKMDDLDFIRTWTTKSAIINMGTRQTDTVYPV